jgi:hypothetical protein
MYLNTILLGRLMANYFMEILIIIMKFNVSQILSLAGLYEVGNKLRKSASKVHRVSKEIH